MVDELTKPDTTSRIQSHYDSRVEEYNERHFDEEGEYNPGAAIEEILVDRIIELDAKRVLDMGCGNGALVHRLCENGIDAVGFDLSEKMIAAGQSILKEDGFDPDRLVQADFRDGIPFEGEFDVVTAIGLFPHLDKIKKNLQVVRDVLDTNGTSFIQFRNELFNLYTMNEYTYHYIWDTILGDVDVPTELSEEFDHRLQEVCRVNEEGVGQTPESDNEGGFHNPITIPAKFEDAGFSVQDIYFYHYHPLPPEFRSVDETTYDEFARRFEHPHDWRGYFMASAFVIEGC